MHCLWANLAALLGFQYQLQQAPKWRPGRDKFQIRTLPKIAVDCRRGVRLNIFELCFIARCTSTWFPFPRAALAALAGDDKVCCERITSSAIIIIAQLRLTESLCLQDPLTRIFAMSRYSLAPLSRKGRGKRRCMAHASKRLLFMQSSNFPAPLAGEGCHARHINLRRSG